jgi:hypothetical protein
MFLLTLARQIKALVAAAREEKSTAKSERFIIGLIIAVLAVSVGGCAILAFALGYLWGAGTRAIQGRLEGKMEEILFLAGVLFAGLSAVITVACSAWLLAGCVVGFYTSTIRV